MSVINSIVPKIAVNSLELLLLSWEAAGSYDKFAVVFLLFPLQIFSQFVLPVDAIYTALLKIS